MNHEAHDFPLMDSCLADARFDELPGYSRNKVRDSYQLPDGRRLLISTDRQSAFDHVLAAVPCKGQVLTQTARYWFDVTADVCPNTSLWPMYDRGERVLYGHELPNGMRKNQKLAEAIITPTTKPAGGGHDEPITEAEILRTELVTTAQWHEVAERSLALFARGQEVAAEKGLILVDTKYEFGVDADGTVVVADEIHTPDSSRYWIAETYQDRFDAGEEPESLDKEFLRLWINSQCDPYRDPIPEIPGETILEFSQKYVDLFERVTGLELERPDPAVPVRDRIRASLARELPEYF